MAGKSPKVIKRDIITKPIGEMLNRSINFVSQNNYFVNFSIFLSVFYLIIRFIDCIYLFPANLGDEYFFSNDLIFYINNGYEKSVIHGISIPFTLISNIFYLLTNNISLSLRLTTSLFTLVLVLYILFRSKIIVSARKLLLFHLFLLIGTTAGTFDGTNNSIFFAGYIIFISESSLASDKSKINIFILVLSSAVVILSRPHVIIYIPAFLFGFFIYRFIKKDFQFSNMNAKILMCFISGFAITLLANYPRLSNGIYRISYADKSYTYKTNDPDFNWVEWAYYSQLAGNNKRLGFFSNFVDYEEVKKYKESHGESSLPRSFSTYLIKHTPFVIRRALSSVIEIFLISIRYVGIYLILLPFYIYYKFKHQKIDLFMLYAFTIIIGIFIWAIIFPTIVEHRWLYPFYIMLLYVVYDDEFIKKENYYNKLNLLNLLILDTVTIWALWKEKLFYYI